MAGDTDSFTLIDTSRVRHTRSWATDGRCISVVLLCHLIWPPGNVKELVLGAWTDPWVWLKESLDGGSMLFTLRMTGCVHLSDLYDSTKVQHHPVTHSRILHLLSSSSIQGRSWTWTTVWLSSRYRDFRTLGVCYDTSWERLGMEMVEARLSA